MLSVSANPWFSCALILTLRVVVVGIAWSWLVPVTSRGEPRAKALRGCLDACVALLIGILLTLVSNWLLFELGVGKPAYALAASALIAAAGFAARIRSRCTAGLLTTGAPLAMLTFLGIAAVMFLPRQSEWFMGGWDPGAYLNQGVCVARTGTFHPGPGTGYSILQPEEFAPFARGDGDYLECFPGIPIDPEDGRLLHYFFRLTPTFLATVAQSGGLRAATRANTLMGVLAALLFLGALVALAPKRPSLALFSTLFLVTHPLWLYHLHLPVTEVLQLFLVGGIGLLVPYRARGRATPWVLGLAVFAAVLNRFSFLPFGGVLMLGVAILDRSREDRLRVLYERSVLLGAIVAGAAFDMLGCSVTMLRMAVITDKLVAVAGASIAAAILLDATVAICPKLRHAGSRLLQWLSRAGVVLVLAGIGGVWFFCRTGGSGRCSATMHGVAPYLGLFLAGAACLGALHLFWTEADREERIRPGVVYLFVIAAITTVGGGFIADLYPWATRRHLVYAVPCITILAGHLMSILWGAGARRRLWRGVAVGLATLLVATNAKRSWHAWDRTEYNGLSAILQQVAEQIDDHDVVVCDHPWWATALSLTYGKTVLNAREFYESKSSDTMKKGMAVLARLKASEKRIRFLTSTRTAALSVYPEPISGAKLDWESGEVAFMEFIHHRSADDFEMQERRHAFRLFTWYGP